MVRISQIRVAGSKIIITLIAAVTVFGLAANLRSTSLCPSINQLPHSSRERSIRSYFDFSENTSGSVATVPEVTLPFHPFDNACKFPFANFYPSDISHYRVAERLRSLQCPYADFDYATMDSEGYMYVHPHFTAYPNHTDDNKCTVTILEGGLRNKTTGKGKDEMNEVVVLDAPENVRFWVNADAFYIRCKNKDGKLVWEQPFAGMRKQEMKKNEITRVPDLESFDTFGRQKKAAARPPRGRLSIDILGFDSTSRTMFYRHLPRTVETMHKLGYHTLHGYNKVGDNSAVNLLPVLAGDLPEALMENSTDVSGDINAEWIVPTTKKLDPTNIKFLWKLMKDKYGCRSMLNEDISMRQLGLFHYPQKEFLPGFTESPADHFYRVFYLAIYKNWKYGPCRDGKQIQKLFVDLWRRFSKQYKDICHFGFTFVTTLTHETGLLLETMDEFISSSLENMYFTGALDNSVSVLMGDHGNRIGLVQYSYSGRIEERMPLMSFRFPEWFRQKYPTEYGNFLKNKWKLTSNFDVHQTLKDIVLMRFGDDRRNNASEGRGISLFDEIPSSRTCREATIPENFCSCMVDRKNVNPFKNLKAKDDTYIKEKSLAAIKFWLRTNDLLGCVNVEPLTVESEVATLSLNPFVRHGYRSKANLQKNKDIERNEAKLDFLHHEMTVAVPMATSPDEHIKMLFRIQEETRKDEFQVEFEPSVHGPPSECSFLSLFDVCECLLHR